MAIDMEKYTQALESFLLKMEQRSVVAEQKKYPAIGFTTNCRVAFSCFEQKHLLAEPNSDNRFRLSLRPGFLLFRSSHLQRTG